jgi:hypothetical protein
MVSIRHGKNVGVFAHRGRSSLQANYENKDAERRNGTGMKRYLRVSHISPLQGSAMLSEAAEFFAALVGFLCEPLPWMCGAFIPRLCE